MSFRCRRARSQRRAEASTQRKTTTARHQRFQSTATPVRRLPMACPTMSPIAKRIAVLAMLVFSGSDNRARSYSAHTRSSSLLISAPTRGAAALSLGTAHASSPPRSCSAPAPGQCASQREMPSRVGRPSEGASRTWPAGGHHPAGTLEPGAPVETKRESSETERKVE